MGAEADDDFVAHAAPWRRAGLLVIAIGFVAMGAWMAGLLGSDPALDPDQPGKIVAIAELLAISPATAVHGLGWFCILFFGAGGVVLAIKLFERGPVLSAGPSGIWSRRWPNARVPWQEMAETRLIAIRRTKMLSVRLVDPAAHPRGKLNTMDRMNRSMGYGDVSYMLQGTDGRFDDLIATVARYRPDLIRD